MPTWDAPGATWDSGTWDSAAPVPNPNPKTKHKTMTQQKYFPTRIGDQIVWLHNFKAKLPGYATTLALVAGDVTARLLDVDNAVYALDAYRGAVSTFPNAAFQRIDDALHNGAVTGSIAWLPFAAPTPVPAAVAYGCLTRVFTYINDTIKKAAAYDTAIGADLGTETPAAPAPAAISSPVFTLRTTAGGKLEVVWTKGAFDGVKLEFDLGTAGKQSDVDLRPNYTLNWLPATGTSAIIKVRLMYILKGNDTGTWSDWQQWTLTGV